MPKNRSERKKEDMKKNNEEAPEYKNNPPINFLRKQIYERQMHMEKVETKMSSAQQINCCMSLKHTTDSDLHLRSPKDTCPGLGEGSELRATWAWPGCCSIPHRSPQGMASGEAKGEHTPQV